MELLVGCLAVLILTASIIDWLLKDEAIIALRRELQKTGEKITDLNTGAVVLSANRLFCQIFDALYGPHTWSWRRFSRSCFLSLLFVLFSILIIGFENTFLGVDEDLVVLVYVTALFASVNILADFVSLQETRGVLEYARGKGIAALGIWVCIDLMLTTTIYVIGLGSAFFGVISSMEGLNVAIDQFSDYERFIEMLLARDGALPFFISTFGTSIVWFLFVALVLLIRAMSRNSRFLKLALDIISESSTPARTAAGIVIVPVVIVFSVVKTIRWLF